MSKRITLGQVISGDRQAFYRVKKLVNSTRFMIGEKLSSDRVTGLCKDAAWTVTIIDGGL